MENKKSPNEGIDLMNYKNNSNPIKCKLSVSNWDEFIKHAEKIKKENKSIDEALNFNFKFYIESI